MPAGPPDDEAELVSFDDELPVSSEFPQPDKKRTEEERQNEKRIDFIKKLYINQLRAASLI